MRAPITSEASPATTSPVSVAKRHCKTLWEGTSFPFPSSALIARPSLNQEPPDVPWDSSSIRMRASASIASRICRSPARPSFVPRCGLRKYNAGSPIIQSQSVDDLVPVDLVGSAHGGRALRARLEEAAEDLVQRRQRRRAHHGGRGALHRGRLSFGRHRCD